jgi:hypothetical protein
LATIKDWAFSLGDFFTETSGHPGDKGTNDIERKKAIKQKGRKL